MADVPPGYKLTNGRPIPNSCGFRNLHHRSHVQGRTAARTFLSRGNTRIFAAQVDVGWNGMSAYRAMGQSHGMFFSKCFHRCCPFHSIGRLNHCTGCAKFVNIIKFEGRNKTVLQCYAEEMTQQPAPKIQLINTAEYRENYANSVQVRVNLWDFFLMFGRVNQTSPDSVAIHNFQGVYVSPQQAKALLNVLRDNVTQYESAFGEIKLEPRAGSSIVQ